MRQHLSGARSGWVRARLMRVDLRVGLVRGEEGRNVLVGVRRRRRRRRGGRGDGGGR